MEINGGVDPNYYIKTLSNYAECMKPYLRTAQDLYVGSYIMVENQPFDLNAYCVKEREFAVKAKAAVEAQMNQQ